MKRLSYILWFFLFVGSGCLYYILNTIPPKLVLDQTEGPVPLQVHILAPEEYLGHANGIASPWTNCGIRVNWGDGLRPDNIGTGEPCAPLAEHTFFQKGTFKVVASIGGFQTEDGATVTTWTGIVMVTVK